MEGCRCNGKQCRPWSVSSSDLVLYCLTRLVVLNIMITSLSLQYTAILLAVKNNNFQLKIFDIFINFSQNMDLLVQVTSTHNLCFRAKIRKNVYPRKPQFCYIKVGCKGVHITQTCYPDEFMVKVN